MARVFFGGGVTGITGKLGGSVFQNSRGGPTIRTLSIPTNPKTPSQTLARGKMGVLAHAWNTLLTDAQRTAWNQRAKGKEVGTGKNAHFVPTGSVYFNHINRIILEAGGSIILTPPISNFFPLIGSPLLTLDAFAQTLTFSWTTPTVALPLVLSLWSTQPYIASNNYAANTQKFTGNFSPASSPLDFTAEWKKVHGGWALESGCKVFIAPYIVNIGNGDITPEIAYSAIAP